MSKLLAATAAIVAFPAFAQDKLEIVGAPHPGGMGLQAAGGELGHALHRLDHMVLIIMSAIVVLVTLLIIYSMIRFNRKANPSPARFTHNTPVEVAWTLIPILILVFIGAYSLPVLFQQQEIPEGDIHIKVTGHQWYWSYEYTDNEFGFDSFMIGDSKVLDDDTKAQLKDAGYSPREFKLAVDNAVVVPINKVVVMTVTGADVIHSWTVPSFGVKQDAVPGRLAHLWFKPEREGIYFGQCSELCGKDHAFMPITVKVVSQEAYDKWLTSAKAQFASLPDTAPYKVASAE